MRTIGNLILLPLLAIFGFGFLLAYALNITSELTEARGELAHMQEKLRMLDAQYLAVIEEKNILTEQTLELTNENTGLRARVEILEAEQQILTSQIEILQRKQAFIERANPILVWLDSSSVKRVAVLLGVPLVPLSFGTIYMITHRKMINPPASPMNGGGQATVQASLTRDEIQLIVRRRRSMRVHERAD